jgi:hypothetical protein
MRAEFRRHPANLDSDERSRLLEASEQEAEPYPQQTDERAVDPILGKRRLCRSKQALGESELTLRERHLAARCQYPRAHRITLGQRLLGAPEQLLRGVVLTELRHRHTSQRERTCILARADEAKRWQRIEAREVSRGCLEIAIVSQLLLPGRYRRAVHQIA